MSEKNTELKVQNMTASEYNLKVEMDKFLNKKAIKLIKKLRKDGHSKENISVQMCAYINQLIMSSDL